MILRGVNELNYTDVIWVVTHCINRMINDANVIPSLQQGHDMNKDTLYPICIRIRYIECKNMYRVFLDLHPGIELI